MGRVANAALTGVGFSVRMVTNGIQALRVLMAEPRAFDLVVLDLVLPWINGLDVLAAIRADASTRHLPVLVTTGTFVTSRVCRRSIGSGPDQTV